MRKIGGVLVASALGLVGLGFTPCAALAGAWTQEEGRGVFIFTNGRRTSTPGSLIGGATEGTLTISQVYVEYGLLEALTLGASTFLELDVGDPNRGSASAALLGRVRLWQNDTGAVASAQLAVSYPFESVLSEEFGASKPGSVPEVQFRGLFGQSWWGEWGSAFLSSEAGYHLRGEEAPDELRLDATIGIEPWHCCLAIFSMFTALPVQEDRPGRNSDAVIRIAPSLAYTIWPELTRNAKKPSGPVLPATVQIGLDYELLNNDDGLGVFVSLWRRF